MIPGGGARLFEHLGDARPRLELLRAVATPEVTHLTELATTSWVFRTLGEDG